MSEQANQFLTQANQAIQDGQFAEALALAERAIGLSPELAEAYMARGIAQASLGQSDAATQSLREAIRLAPTSAKPYYNLAAHQYRLGQRTEALALAREAIRLEPGNAAAGDLVRLIESETGGPAPTEVGAAGPMGVNAGSPYGTPVGGSPYVRPGYAAPEGALPFIDRMGSTWVAIGWALSLITLVSLIGSLALIWPMMGEIMANPDNSTEIQQRFTSQAGIGYTLLNILSWGSWLGIVVWAVLDIVHKRSNWAWLIGFVCCCQFIIGPLYILLGRKS